MFRFQGLLAVFLIDFCCVLYKIRLQAVGFMGLLVICLSLSFSCWCMGLKLSLGRFCVYKSGFEEAVDVAIAVAVAVVVVVVAGGGGGGGGWWW